MVARDDQRGVGRGAQQKVAHGAGDGALVKVVAGEEAARADLGPPRRQVLARAVVVVARVDVGEIERGVAPNTKRLDGVFAPRRPSASLRSLWAAEPSRSNAFPTEAIVMPH